MSFSEVIHKKYSHLVGTSYDKKDCWGIVKDFYKCVFNIELNNYYESIPKNRSEANSLIYSNVGDFELVSGEKMFGDILLIRVQGVDSHIAVYLGDNRMLHTTIHSGCLIERTIKWQKLISGIYRVKR